MSVAATPKYSIKLPRNQDLSLPHPIILYLLETESPHLLQKLQKSCKYFFAKKKVLVIAERVKFQFKNGEYCLEHWRGTTLPLGETPFWLTDFECRANNCYPFFRPHIYRVTLTYLNLWHQNLSLADIDFLLADNKLEWLYLSRVDLQNSDGSPIPIDYILAKVPNITHFNFYNKSEIYSNELLAKLNQVKLFKKLKWFHLSLYRKSEELDPEILGKFIEDNLAPAGRVEFWFSRIAPEREKIRVKLQKIVDGWVLPGGKPSFDVF